MQFIWWPEWRGIKFARFERGLARIYQWSLVLGWLEIRRWKYHVPGALTEAEKAEVRAAKAEWKHSSY